MKLGEGLAGSVCFRLTSGDVSLSLQELTNSNLVIFNAEIESELSAIVTLSAKDFKKAVQILKKHGARCEVLNHRGLSRMFYNIQKRIILLAGCTVLMILTIFLPTRIFFWEVNGNIKLPNNYIIAIAQEEGLCFGCKRAEIRNDIIKNQLLARIPQLEWVGITTSGCVVTISVSESQPINTNKEQSVGNIVAVCDGVISSVAVTKGNLICKPGQAVQKGQVLISGYQDLGLVLRHSGAEGEVYANTYRTLEGFSLSNGEERTDVRAISRNISIRIGKKLIKFSKDSGISHTSCVKMYWERYMMLPGGFRLPASLIIEKSYDYETIDHNLSEGDYDWIGGAMKTYLQDQMLAGAILFGDVGLQIEDHACRFWGAYGCTEQIGINKIEEILPYGKNG